MYITTRFTVCIAIQAAMTQLNTKGSKGPYLEAIGEGRHHLFMPRKQLSNEDTEAEHTVLPRLN